MYRSGAWCCSRSTRKILEKQQNHTIQSVQFSSVAFSDEWNRALVAGLSCKLGVEPVNLTAAGTEITHSMYN